MKFPSYDLKGVLGTVDIDFKSKLGEGATASIYPAISHGQLCAAKIYKQDNKVDEAKIRAMLANVPANVRLQIAGASHPQLAWPFALIQGPSGNGIGYLMPVVDLASSFSLDHFYDQTLIKKLKSPSEDALSFKLEIARNLSLLIADLHDHRHCFIDFKPQNIRVSLSSHVVTLVDCDGFSVAGPDGKRYPADRVSADYIAPEASKGGLRPSQLGVAQDLYALAVILFQLLNRGTHPFQGIVTSPSFNATTNDEHAAQGLYPYGLTANPHVKPRPQSIHDFLDNGLRLLFDKAFVGDSGERPTAREWADCFDKLLRNKGLARCKMHPYDLTHMRFASQECPACYLSGLTVPRVKRTAIDLGATAPNGGSSIAPSVATSSKPAGSSANWQEWVGTILVASLLIAIFFNKSTTAPDTYPVPTSTPAPQPTPPVSLEGAVAAVESAISAAQWITYLPTVQDLQVRYPVFSTPAGKHALEKLVTKIEEKKVKLNSLIPNAGSGNVEAESNNKCSKEVLASRSVNTLCLIYGNSQDTCSDKEIRAELANRGVSVFEGGCIQGTPQKPKGIDTGSARPVKPNLAIDNRLYDEALRQIEIRHPELNPDYQFHRPELVDQATRKMQTYVRQGLAKQEALLRAVAEMERNSAFHSMERTEPTNPVARIDPPREEPKPSVADTAAPSASSPKCRWISYKDWTCK